MTSPRDTITYTYKTDERDLVRGMGRVRTEMSEVDTLGKTLAKTLRAEADASGKLRVAQAKLADVRQSGKAKAAQLATAEENVAKAQRGVVAAAGEARSAQLLLAKANERTGDTAERAERDIRKLGRSAQDGGRGFVSLRKSVGGVSLGIGQALHGLAPFGISVAAVGGLTVGLGLKIYGAAANLELMDRKARIVFGSSFPQLAKWAKTVSTRFGLTSREVLSLTVGFADMLVPMGFTRGKAAQLAQQFAKMAPVLSQWSGGQFDTGQAAEALTGALTGEYDTLQRLGIPISDALVQGEALRLGLVKTTVDTKDLSLAQQRAHLAQSAYNAAVKKYGPESQQAARASIALQVAQGGVEKAAKGSNLELTAAAKAQAALSLITSGSADAQTAFANGQDTLAAKSAAAKARFGELRDTILVALIPALDKAGKWFTDHQDDVISFGFKAARGFVTFGETAALQFAGILDGIGGMAIGLGGLLRASNETFAGILEGAILALGVISPATAEAARGALTKFNEFRQKAGGDLVDVGNKAKGMADAIRRNVPPAADAARGKLTELERAALGLPPNPQIKPTVPTYSQSAAALNDLRHKGEWLANHPVAYSVAVRVRGEDVTTISNNLGGGRRSTTRIAAYGGWLKKAYGGPISGHGWVPGHSAGDRSDNIPTLMTGDEFVVQRPTARKIKREAPGFLEALNAGQLDIGGDKGAMRARYGVALRRARGGSIPSVQAFLRGTDPLPYIWGGAGPGGYDCSGLVGAAYGLLTGKGGGHGQRYFTTDSIGAGQGFRPGLGSAFVVGVTPGRGHMAMQLGSLKAEARSTASGIIIGPGATSPASFARKFYLPQAGGQWGRDGLTARQIHQTVALMRPQIIDRVFRQLGVRKADTGGYLSPGLNPPIYNGTGRPEPITTAASMDAVVAVLQRVEALLARLPVATGREVGTVVTKLRGGRA